MLPFSMSWYRKEAPTPFEQQPLEGLFFLDGNLVSRVVEQQWTEGMKYPMISFPSGAAFELWESNLLHFFGEMDLSLFSTRDEGQKSASDIASIIGYLAIPRGDSQLELVGQDTDEHFLLTFDNAQRRIVDAVPMTNPVERGHRPAMELLDAESRAKLPPLYSGEMLGLAALAQVKFFTSDSNWTWYASEGSPVDENGYFDTEKEKVDFLFFGLVIGFEIELGFFSLSELTATHGSLGLPIERDKFFRPKTLQDLKTRHQNERYSE
ncbi:MAG: DUF2958 domain-containing protein [Chloroflexota bacterium]